MTPTTRRHAPICHAQCCGIDHCAMLGLGHMKLFATLLSIVMFLHLQCGGSCLGGASGGPVHSAETSGEPSCHHHDEAPTSNDQQPSQDASSPCTRGQFIESRIYDGGKIVLQTIGLLPAEVSPVQAAAGLALPLLVSEGPHLISPPPIPFSILRI